MSPYRSRQFKELQSKWYQKLEAKGFKDIEDTSSKFEYLKVWDSHWFLERALKMDFEAKQEFYLMASEFYLKHSFNSRLEKEIFRHFSEGRGLRQIAEHLRSKGVKINKDTVSKHLNPLIEKMKRGY